VSRLDAATLRRFVALAGARLSGDWVVIGGCVLPLLGLAHRVTMDIDVAGPDEAGMRQVLILAEIAEELGLPVSSINQAGSHFLRRVPGWAEHLVPIHRGKGATIHVPDATLYLLLKARRLTETDLLDCAKMLEHAAAHPAQLDAARVRDALHEALAQSPPRPRRARLTRLLALLAPRVAGRPRRR
jgi:hypothetical protein